MSDGRERNDGGGETNAVDTVVNATTKRNDIDITEAMYAVVAFFVNITTVIEN